MAKCSLLISILLSVVTFGLSTPTPSEKFQRRVVLSAPDNYIIHWSFNDTSIMFETHVKATGYTGFGLSPNGGMTGADIMVGGVKDGIPYLEDRMATMNGEPSLDEQQDWVLIAGRQEAGYTILKFSRLLQTCDNKDMAISTDTARIIWSYSISTTLTYHNENRGTKSVQLIGEEPGADVELPSNAVYYDFLMDHIDPVIQKENVKIVHHINFKACSIPLDDSLHGKHVSCAHGENNPLSYCSNSLGGWAIGSGIMYLPSIAGFPIGDGSFTFMVMEVHYNNPTRRSGIVDSSGLRLWVTPTLRQHDAGILQISNTHEFIIPPGQNSFTIHSWCPNLCYNKFSSSHPKGIYVFSNGFHAHQLAYAMRLRHFRNGIELPPINEESNYDFNFQHFTMISPARQVLLTDDLMVECVYRSMSRTKVTIAGPGSSSEMCFTSMLYYPRLPFNMCTSTVTSGTIKDSLAYVNANQSNHSKMSESQMLIKADWTQKSKVDQFQNKMNSGKRTYLCQDTYVAASVPNITNPYFSVDPCSKGLLNNGGEVSNQMDKKKNILGDTMNEHSSKELNDYNHPKDRSKTRSNIERLIQTSKGSFIRIGTSYKEIKNTVNTKKINIAD